MLLVIFSYTVLKLRRFFETQCRDVNHKVVFGEIRNKMGLRIQPWVSCFYQFCCFRSVARNLADKPLLFCKYFFTIVNERSLISKTSGKTCCARGMDVAITTAARQLEINALLR